MYGSVSYAWCITYNQILLQSAYPGGEDPYLQRAVCVSILVRGGRARELQSGKDV